MPRHNRQMESGKRVIITFKPSRLTNVLESNASNEMIKRKNKAGAAERADKLADRRKRGAMRTPRARGRQCCPGISRQPKNGPGTSGGCPK